VLVNRSKRRLMPKLRVQICLSFQRLLILFTSLKSKVRKMDKLWFLENRVYLPLIHGMKVRQNGHMLEKWLILMQVVDDSMKVIEYFNKENMIIYSALNLVMDL